MLGDKPRHIDELVESSQLPYSKSQARSFCSK